MEKKEVCFKLSKTLRYANGKGDFENTGEIVMHPPSMEHFIQDMELAQLFTRCMFDTQKVVGSLDEEAIEKAKQAAMKKKKDGGDAMDRETIKQVLLSSSSVKFKEVSQAFQEIAGSACFVAKGIPLTDGLIVEMEVSDYLNLICEYIVNFTSPLLD